MAEGAKRYPPSGSPAGTRRTPGRRADRMTGACSSARRHEDPRRDLQLSTRAAKPPQDLHQPHRARARRTRKQRWAPVQRELDLEGAPPADRQQLIGRSTPFAPFPLRPGPPRAPREMGMTNSRYGIVINQSSVNDGEAILRHLLGEWALVASSASGLRPDMIYENRREWSYAGSRPLAPAEQRDEETSQ
jgi:hypothetical protein